MLRYTGTTYGKVYIEQVHKDIKQRFTIEIREGNCLAVFIHVRKATDEELTKNPQGKYIHTLWNFLADEQHAKNILKHQEKVLGDEVLKIELNMYYKECYTLLKYFMKSGYKVTCYYKEPKK